MVSIEPDPRVAEKTGAIYSTLEDYDTKEKYDIVWLSHVLEHLDNPVVALNRCYDMTSQNGMLCIMVPDCTNVNTDKESRLNKYHKWHFTKPQMEAICKETKYVMREIQSFRKITGNRLRIQKVFTTAHYFPYEKTGDNDGYEMRVLLAR